MKQNKDTISLEEYTGRNKRMLFMRYKMRMTRERKQLRNKQGKQGNIEQLEGRDFWREGMLRLGRSKKKRSW